MQILMFRSCKSAIVRPVRFESLSTGLMLTPAKSCLSIYFWIAYMMKCVLLAKPCLAPMDCQWLNRDRFWRQVFAQWCKGKGARTLQVGLLQGRNLFFTSSAQDLIVRFEAKNQSVFDGVAFADAWNPHLATFALDPGGAWELVSFVLFNYPAPPPVGAQCRRDG